MDDNLYIFVNTDKAVDDIKQFIANITKLNPLAFHVKVIDKIPQNESGKTQYVKLEQYYMES